MVNYNDNLLSLLATDLQIIHSNETILMSKHHKLTATQSTDEDNTFTSPFNSVYVVVAAIDAAGE